ncbi:TolC family protein [Aquirufa antheringensis]|jgi:outer membrane protein|uniref:TolC family protein n=1 Tax=Aquirufa antheringensis TaxID=2516559 RepID=A0A4Q9B917_9BACT|nr:TolC family protein [Aquirufa antheringensis]MCZ2485570.1 TolC family protein [Aquirufa antheringensis]MCZ2486725.1 TolC family protein [Aquirufa antheringensis]MCZ2488494.1 TolC family protein [Aquirufa antheringensis]TBH71952.1 TolC family protein [Aquirufa antheringensis]
MKLFRLALIAFLSPIAAQAQHLLTLEDAIQQGITKQYSIQISRQRERIAANENSLGNAGFLPTITGTANKNYTISGIDQSFFGGLRPPLVQSGVNSNSGNLGMAMAWTLYDGKGMFVLRDRYKELQNLGAKQTESSIENLIALISSTYYDIIRQNLRVNNFKKGLEISNDRLKLAKDRFEVGQGSKVDYYSAQVDYNEDKALLIAQEQSYTNTKIGFNALLVKDFKADFQIVNTIDLLPKLKMSELKMSALSQNPTLIGAILSKKISDLDTKNLQSQQKPQIDLVAGYALSNVANGAGFGVEKGSSDVFNYGLRATINIFDGYNQKRRIQNAKINAEIAALQVEDLKNALLSALEKTYVTYENSMNLIQLETENYTIAKQNIDIAFDRFKVGIATSYELREVQRNAVAAETRLIEAKYAAKTAEIELIRLSGNLL